ncbi:MAG: hypothetical protein KHZ77_04795 [Veillonella sp.]|nr:hypothetical protein [Veillonella sp.]MBS4913465.1 hypothetical protein [Veillonella sp.]
MYSRSALWLRENRSNNMGRTAIFTTDPTVFWILVLIVEDDSYFIGMVS